ncbi:MAG: hypothetical protein ACK5AZ_16225 [Bryobacteraceae bacterium]
MAAKKSGLMAAAFGLASLHPSRYDGIYGQPASLRAAARADMRLPLLVLTLALLAGCAPAPPPEPPPGPPEPDPTTEAWYTETAEELAALTRKAETLLRRGRRREAGGMIPDGQELVNRLVAVPRPTLQAVEAVSDFDDLHGRMLLASHEYGWARLAFQKNVARWKSWQPQTDETARRRRLAEQRIEEVDRLLAQPPR